MHAFRAPATAALAVAFGLGLAVSGLGAFAAEDDPVVAIVNGNKILKSHVQEAQQMLPRQYQGVPLEQMYPALVDSLIDTALAAADARARGLHEDPDFRARMARIEDQLLQRIVLQNEMAAPVSDGELQERYEKMIGGLADKEEVNARHILLKTEAEAKAVIEELDKGGDFIELAKKKSTGPSGPSGGDLGFFGRGQMVPEFEQAAFAMEKGKHSTSPVKTQFGYHVIKLVERRKAEVPSFESVSGQLRGEISQERGTTYVAKLREKAEVTRFTLDGEPLADKKAEPTPKAQ